MYSRRGGGSILTLHPRVGSGLFWAEQNKPTHPASLQKSSAERRTPLVINPATLKPGQAAGRSGIRIGCVSGCVYVDRLGRTDKSRRHHVGRNHFRNWDQWRAAVCTKNRDFASNMASPGHLTMPRSSGPQFYPMKPIIIMQNGAMATRFVKK